MAWPTKAQIAARKAGAPTPGKGMRRPPQPPKPVEEPVSAPVADMPPPVPPIEVKDRAERSDTEKVRLSEVANLLLQNPAYLSAVKDAEADIAARWRKTAPENFEAREALHAEQRALDLVKLSLAGIEADGRHIKNRQGAFEAAAEHRSHFRGAA